MKKGLTIGLVILGVILLFVLIIIGLFISGYNNFVSLDQNVNAKWSEVENQYQRQADLIPNLVSTVSSAVNSETKFVKDVVEARTKWLESNSQLEKDGAGQQMNNGISAFVSAVAESYPTLQANKQYVALTDELTGTQNRIAVARGRYIESIQEYNIAIKRFPSIIIAGMFGFSAKDYYKASEGSMNTPNLGNGTLP
jgi:LemA protein